MARRFTSASSEKIDLALGAGGSITGACSLLAIVKPASDVAAITRILQIGTNNTTLRAIQLSNAQILNARSANVTTGSATLAVNVANGWQLVGWSKAAGSAVPRFHQYIYSSNTWNRVSLVATLADSTPSSGSVLGANAAGGSPFDGDIAIAGAYAANLTDAQIESMAYDLNAWFQIQPNGLWILDQAAVTMLVPDLTGNGANQTGITGTTVSPLSVPVFSYGQPTPARYYVPTIITETTTTTSTVSTTLQVRMHVGKRRMAMRSRGIRFLTPSVGAGSSSPPAGYDDMTIHSLDFAYNTADLNNGLTIFTPAVDDILLDVWVEVTTAFNGTTPKWDVGTFVGGNAGILDDTTGLAIGDLVPDSEGSSNAGLLNNGSGSNYALSNVSGVTGVRGVPARFTATNPFKIVVSQNGAKGGTAIGGSTGAATVYALVIPAA